MAKPFHKLLGESLARVEQFAKDGIVQSEKISRLDRERLLKSGWLQQIITGWYLFTSPQAIEGESTIWFASFWDFMRQYLQDRYGEDYCLSAESSLYIYTADTVIPKQVVVITKSGGNHTLSLPHHTSILMYQDVNKFPDAIDNMNKLQVMPVRLALCRASKSFFQRQPMNAKIALSMIKDPSEILRPLLAGGMAQAAGRLAGAYQQMGRSKFTNTILKTMKAAGFTVTQENPFDTTQSNYFSGNRQRSISPYYARIINMWSCMRKDVIDHFPKRKPTKGSTKIILKNIDDVYVNDAYNSLSIEGYKVTKQLIKKIQDGEWNPDKSESDFQQRNAMAAKGYYLAFLEIKKSIHKVLSGSDVAGIVKRGIPNWYYALFSPAIDAGLLQSADLAGFRDDRVFIRHSLHVPPPKEALLDCMDAFITCLKNEEDPVVRAVLGHFVFVFIHPYMDGNGRIGRFLMNTLWIAAGYPWTIVRLESRQDYLKALETASTSMNIIPFTHFLANEMAVKW